MLLQLTTEFSDCMAVGGLPGPRLDEEEEEEDEEDDVLREELIWLPVRILECNEEEEVAAMEEGDEDVMVLAEGGGDWRSVAWGIFLDLQKINPSVTQTDSRSEENL